MEFDETKESKLLLILTLNIIAMFFKDYSTSTQVYRGQIFDVKEYFKNFLNGTAAAVANIPRSETFQISKMDVALEYFETHNNMNEINQNHRKKSDKGMFVSQAEFEKYQSKVSEIANNTPSDTKVSEK